MTARRVRIQRRAQAHLHAAYDWYERQRPGLGREFLDAVDACLARIAENPAVYPVYRERIQRATTHRFPYLVFYVADAEEAVILAVLHARRDPRRWP